MVSISITRPNLKSFRAESSNMYLFVCYRCKEGRVGIFCECDQAESGVVVDSHLCRRDNSSQVCSGHGHCLCGKCVCHKSSKKPSHSYYGQHCECSDFSCDHHRGLQCGGMDDTNASHTPTGDLTSFLLSCSPTSGHGRCVCGVCSCLPAFSGQACECPLSLEPCLSQDGQICAGRGDCHCGTCICHDNRFQGPTCEICPSCPGLCTSHRCTDFPSSVQLCEKCKCLPH